MRLFILMLSMGSVVGYGYALAGYGIKFVGRGDIRYDYIIGGLIGGTVAALLALFLWKKWLESNIGDDD